MEELTIAMMLKKLNDEMNKRANADLERQNLTFSQMHVLIYLYRSDKEEIPLKELERRFHVAQATMAGIVKRLEAKKFVSGRIDPDDKRVKLVSLTSSGREFMKENRKEMEEHDAYLVKDLSDEEQQEMKRLLTILYNTCRSDGMGE